MTNEEKRAKMTPSGLPPGLPSIWAGRVEPFASPLTGPIVATTGNLAAGPTPSPSPTARPATPTTPAADVTQPAPPFQEATIPIAMPKLDSPMVQRTNQPQIPWQQMLINMYRLNQPTGITPGTYGGFTVNMHGQIVNTVTSGASINSPVLGGNPTAPTAPANDNSQTIANTAFVQSQAAATQSSLQSWVQQQNYVTQQFLHNQNFATQNFVAQQIAPINTSVGTNTTDIATINSRLAAAGIP